MLNPNEAIRRILQQRDPEYRDLEGDLQSLEAKLSEATDEATKKKLQLKIRDLSDRMSARISFARSA